MCVTGDQLGALWSGGATPASTKSVSPSSSNPSDAAAQNSSSNVSKSVSSTTPAGTPPPVIQINGENPAVIRVGDIYADLGATITGPKADQRSSRAPSCREPLGLVFHKCRRASVSVRRPSAFNEATASSKDPCSCEPTFIEGHAMIAIADGASNRREGSDEMG